MAPAATAPANRAKYYLSAYGPHLTAQEGWLTLAQASGAGDGETTTASASYQQVVISVLSGLNALLAALLGQRGRAGWIASGATWLVAAMALWLAARVLGAPEGRARTDAVIPYQVACCRAVLGAPEGC